MPGRLQTQHPFECFNTRLPWPINPEPPVIIATATYAEVQRQGDNLLVKTLFDLHKHGKVLGLRLTRRQVQTDSSPLNEILADVATLPGFEHVGSMICFNRHSRKGDEWRSAPAGFSKDLTTTEDKYIQALNRVHSATDPGSSLEDFSSDSQEGYWYLTIHGRGPSALVLAKVPRAYPMQSSFEPSPEGSSTGQNTPIRDTMRCLLCEQDFEKAGGEPSVCLFHPGKKIQLRDGSDSGDSDSSYDDLPHDERLNWTCCGRRGELSGCAVETKHILMRRGDLLSLHHGQIWRSSW